MADVDLGPHGHFPFWHKAFQSRTGREFHKENNTVGGKHISTDVAGYTSQILIGHHDLSGTPQPYSDLIHSLFPPQENTNVKLLLA
jgi:hypothetical protein